MNFLHIEIAHEGPVAIVTLNRPQRRNALSLELMLELLDGLDQLGRNRDVRAVILAAAGKVFTTGQVPERQDHPGHVQDQREGVAVQADQ